MDLESINVKFYLTKTYKAYLRKYNNKFRSLEADFHNFHIAQSIIAKVKAHELQEVGALIDHLPKRDKCGDLQQHEQYSCETDYIRRKAY